ncbi:MAG: hypothetical protein U1C56_00480, partial [Candidatus Curtissbacteria bacterium]|nr:hypothetical protein [Candidatus Curtissbacteria bacterium]
VPVYLSSELLLDFTRQTLESIQSENHELSVYVIVNYSLPELCPTRDKFKLHESIKNYQVIGNPKGNEVGASWNLGIKTALADGCDFAAILNNDLVLHRKCVDNLMTFADAHPEFILWTATEWIDVRTLGGVKEADINWDFDEHPHFSFFMVNQKTIDIVGRFDENMTMAYSEDSEMHYRIVLSGNKAGKTNAAKFYHYGSRTIRVDDELYEKNKKTYEYNRAYVIKKWGFDPHNTVFEPPEKALETGYKTPFNRKDMTLRDW